MPKVGGKRKKTRTHKENQEDPELLGRIPKAFIIKRGKVSTSIKSLTEDYREIMYPYTSMHLQDSDRTKIKDYIKAAKFYQISHMAIFTSTAKNSYLRFLKNPTGPTITFKILSYSNRSEVLNAQRRFKSFARVFSPALLIMNGFNVSDDDLPQSNDKQNQPTSQHIKLIGSMIQSMFPPINVKKSDPKHQKRAVLFSYENGRIYVRHFHITYSLKGVEKKIKKIIKANKTPNLSQFNSFSEFLQNDHQMFASDTEASDIEGAEWDFQDAQQKKKAQKMGLRLHEVGPRLTLQLQKIEEAYLKGNVIYHRIVRKSSKAIEKQRKSIRKRIVDKQVRKQEQEQRVQEKQQKKHSKHQQQVEEEEPFEQKRSILKRKGDGDVDQHEKIIKKKVKIQEKN